MAVQHIERGNWGPYFDSFTKALVGKRVEIEVTSLDLGDQTLAKWLPMGGISYDNKDDLITIVLEDGVDHMIRHPQEIDVDFSASGLISLAIVDGERRRQIINLKDPLALPAPTDVKQG